MKIAIGEDKKRKIIIEKVRKELVQAVEKQRNIVKLDNFTADELNEVLFDRLTCDRQGKQFALPIEILRKIDMSNVNFADFYADKVDFRGMTGVKIDPNKLYEKNIRGCNFSGVTFLDKFSGGYIDDCNFTGSKNAVILNTVKLGGGNNFGDVTFEGTITKGIIAGSNFSGSKGAVIEVGPGKITSVIDCRLKDAKIKGTFLDCYIAGADFTGACTEAGGKIKIDPNGLAFSSFNGVYVYNFESNNYAGIDLVKNVSGCKFDGVKFTYDFGPIYDFAIAGADFTGSEGAFFFPKAILKNDYHGAKLNGVRFPTDFLITGANLEGTSFKGSVGAVISGLQKSVENADLTDAAVRFNNPQEVLQMEGVKSARYGNRAFTDVFKESISKEFDEPTKLLIKKINDAVTASDK